MYPNNYIPTSEMDWLLYDLLCAREGQRLVYCVAKQAASFCARPHYAYICEYINTHTKRIWTPIVPLQWLTNLWNILATPRRRQSALGRRSRRKQWLCLYLVKRQNGFPGIISRGVETDCAMSLLHSAYMSLENCVLLMCANEERTLQTIHLINNRVRSLLQRWRWSG